MPTKTFNYPFHIGDKSNYGEALRILNDKLESLKKQVSYFDFYNITTAVVNADHFAAQLNSLPLNQSLVINTPPFNYNGETYATGDVVIKNYLGESYHIKAQTGGVYYPQKIEGSNGVYSIHFGYKGSSPTEPNGSNITPTGYTSTAPFAINMTYGGFTAATRSNVYGYWAPLVKQTDGSYLYSFAEENTLDANNAAVVVKPSIQFFLCSEGEIIEEQVFIEYSLSHSNKQWTVSVSGDVCPEEGLYVKVK